MVRHRGDIEAMAVIVTSLGGGGHVGHHLRLRVSDLVTRSRGRHGRADRRLLADGLSHRGGGLGVRPAGRLGGD